MQRLSKSAAELVADAEAHIDTLTVAEALALPDKPASEDRAGQRGALPDNKIHSPMRKRTSNSGHWEWGFCAVVYP